MVYNQPAKLTAAYSELGKLCPFFMWYLAIFISSKHILKWSNKETVKWKDETEGIGLHKALKRAVGCCLAGLALTTLLREGGLEKDAFKADEGEKANG